MPRLNPKYLLLGEIVRPHGVRGELKMRVMTDYPQRIRELKAVYLSTDPDSARPSRYEVTGLRMMQDNALLTLKQITDRDRAELLRGHFVMINVEDAVPLEDDEVYLYQLIGMRVETTDGETLGELIEVLETGANDVYIVDSEKYGEVLIPITPETLVKTDTDANVITINMPEGLLPDKP